MRGWVRWLSGDGLFFHEEGGSLGSGKLIVFEGIEGAGKTTQIQRVYPWLRERVGQEVVMTREPGGSVLGARLREVLLGEVPVCEMAELLLYVADRAQHITECIQPALAEGKIILCDRFTDSTIAYQGYGRGLSLDLIAQLNQMATGGIQADLTLWLDVAVDRGLERMRLRGGADRMEQADWEFHHRVRQGFEMLAKSRGDRILPIDANLPPDQVQAQIRQGITTQVLLRRTANSQTEEDHR